MSTPTILFGIPNCDTIRKARAWLGAHNIAYEFHDYRKHGADLALLQPMAAELGFEAMLNRRGTTWRALPDDAKVQLDESAALRLMQASPALIKRPILAYDGKLHIGFSDSRYQEIFA